MYRYFVGFERYGRPAAIKTSIESNLIGKRPHRRSPPQRTAVRIYLTRLVPLAVGGKCTPPPRARCEQANGAQCLRWTSANNHLLQQAGTCPSPPSKVHLSVNQLVHLIHESATLNGISVDRFGCFCTTHGYAQHTHTASSHCMPAVWPNKDMEQVNGDNYSFVRRKDIPQRRVKRWSFSIQELIKDAAGREHFLHFLEKEFSAENLK